MMQLVPTQGIQGVNYAKCVMYIVHYKMYEVYLMKSCDNQIMNQKLQPGTLYHKRHTWYREC